MLISRGYIADIANPYIPEQMKITVRGVPYQIKKIDNTIEAIQLIISVLSCKLVGYRTEKGTASILPIEMHPQKILEQ